MNAERYFARKLLKEAAVRTYKRIRRPQFKPELEQRRKRECGKDKGRNTHFEPHRRRDGPSCCPVTSSYRRYLGCPQLNREVDKGSRRLEPKKMKRFNRRTIEKCPNDIGWDVARSMTSTAETNLRMAADTKLLAL